MKRLCFLLPTAFSINITDNEIVFSQSSSILYQSSGASSAKELRSSIPVRAPSVIFDPITSEQQMPTCNADVTGSTVYDAIKETLLICTGSKWKSIKGCAPPTSCNNLCDPSTGVHSINIEGAQVDMYCDMDLAGGGWTLISNRRKDSTNTESCGANVADFFNQANGCGSVQAIGPTNSYSLDQSTRQKLHFNEVLVVQYKDWPNIDADDAYILTTSTDLFPSSTGISNFPISKVCNIDQSQCDTSEVYFKFVGDDHYANSFCNGVQNGGYGGNYGLCHNGLGGYESSSLFGDRRGYVETKLWNHPDGAAAFAERIFVR